MMVQLPGTQQPCCDGTSPLSAEDADGPFLYCPANPATDFSDYSFSDSDLADKAPSDPDYNPYVDVETEMRNTVAQKLRLKRIRLVIKLFNPSYLRKIRLRDVSQDFIDVETAMHAYGDTHGL